MRIELFTRQISLNISIKLIKINKSRFALSKSKKDFVFNWQKESNSKFIDIIVTLQKQNEDFRRKFN